MTELAAYRGADQGRLPNQLADAFANRTWHNTAIDFIEGHILQRERISRVARQSLIAAFAREHNFDSLTREPGDEV